jgi:tRNA G18 (ribose-2'-O)-methylase SpoU
MATKAYYRRQFHKDIILSRLQPEGPFPIVLILDHMKPTFNIGKIVRTANALGVREIHLVGVPNFNPKPCKGTLRHTRTRTFESFAESARTLIGEGYKIFALDPAGEVTLGQCELPEKSAFIVGHEEFGLSFKASDFPEVRRIRIPQFGAVQSLNASIAAGATCFEYLRQRNFKTSGEQPLERLGLPDKARSPEC